MARIIITLFWLLCGVAVSAGKVTPVIITAGQSNTDGRVPDSMLPDYIKRDGFGGCMWSYGSGELSGNGSFEQFYPKVARRGGEALWGYDAVVYYRIAKAINREFYVIKESLGGTAVDPRCGSTQGMYWSATPEFLAANTAADRGGKSLLKAFTNNIGACIDSVLSQKPGGYEIKAFLWHQGESDRLKAECYYDNLKAVVSYVRRYLVEKTGDERYNSLTFICGTFSSESRQRSQGVVDALKLLAEEDANFHVIDMYDGSLLDDRLHFDADGAVLFGNRVFDKLVETGAIIAD
ncbi:sialate O-acetylesterase [uncultured Muribaculum sp.]|uniref:sialate O-acetylesterase n=1 Tax=uncultured Muribaculum sp. TaxID=1918613 RepID=UPI0025B76C8F|nr:sialate O-acetylesterase [uncultured Muribaculum sp.]